MRNAAVACMVAQREARAARPRNVISLVAVGAVMASVEFAQWVRAVVGAPVACITMHRIAWWARSLRLRIGRVMRRNGQDKLGDTNTTGVGILLLERWQ